MIPTRICLLIDAESFVTRDFAPCDQGTIQSHRTCAAREGPAAAHFWISNQLLSWPVLGRHTVKVQDANVFLECGRELVIDQFEHYCSAQN